MSFLQKYTDQHKLEPIRGAVKRRLEKVEKRLDAKTQGDENFSDIIQNYADQILSLVERIKKEFSDWRFTIGNVTSAFRFIIDIANEVVVIVKELEGKIVPPNTPPDETKKLKIQFGQELTYFVYLLWDPRLVKWIPVGIESYIEKKVIYWLAGMTLDWAFERFEKENVVLARTILPKPKKVRKPKK